MRKQETLSSDKCPLTVERDGKSDLHAVMLSKAKIAAGAAGPVVSIRIYQPSCEAMRLSVKVVTISVTIGSPAALIVSRASNTSSSSLTSQTAIVDRPWMHCTSERLSTRHVR